MFISVCSGCFQTNRILFKYCPSKNIIVVREIKATWNPIHIRFIFNNHVSSYAQPYPVCHHIIGCCLVEQITFSKANNPVSLWDIYKKKATTTTKYVFFLLFFFLLPASNSLALNLSFYQGNGLIWF